MQMILTNIISQNHRNKLLYTTARATASILTGKIFQFISHIFIIENAVLCKILFVSFWTIIFFQIISIFTVSRADKLSIAVQEFRLISERIYLKSEQCIHETYMGLGLVVQGVSCPTVNI